ncbi:MAG: TRAP transporter substrate-binding protein DctP, partial [Treponemataceae bacterium]
MGKKVVGILVAFAMVAMTSQVVFAGGKSDAAAKVVIKLSDQINEQNPHFKADEFFAKTVAEKSGGSVEVKVFPNSQLGNAREGLEGVLSGSLEAVKVSAAELSTYSSKFSVFSLPYVFTKKSEVFAALDGKVGEMLTKELENKGYKLLAFYDTGFRSIFNGKKPINSIADMKGLKIRVIN